MKFCSLVLELYLTQNFCNTHTDTQTDRHFPKIVKSCSGHPKSVNPLKTVRRKILRNQCFLLFVSRKVINVQSYKKKKKERKKKKNSAIEEK